MKTNAAFTAEARSANGLTCDSDAHDDFAVARAARHGRGRMLELGFAAQRRVESRHLSYNDTVRSVKDLALIDPCG
jgi:hypothetical protein